MVKQKKSVTRMNSSNAITGRHLGLPSVERIKGSPTILY